MSLAPPPPRLPPLAHLATLVAVVRLGGYAAAAQARGVTAGAVRVKIRALEATLGVALIHPVARGVTPTPEAEALVEGVSPILSRLDRDLAPLGTDPPLGALIPFEAAVRLGGFAAAGQSLGLSAGAVAQQAARFEGWAGHALFRRHARGVTPMPEAVAVQRRLAGALHAIGSVLAGLGPAPVRIAALPAVAQLWLAPRLPALRSALGVNVSVTALERPPEAKRAPYDLAVFFAEAGGSVLEADALIPVCAPALATGLRSPADLAGVPILTDSVWSGDWRAWATVAMPGRPVPRGVAHSLYALAVDEAVAGAGVLMGHLALVRRHLAAGTLVAPVPPAVPSPRALRLFRLRPLGRGSAAGRVAAWLQTA